MPSVRPLRITVMLTLFKSRAFATGFFAALALFILINAYSYINEMTPDMQVSHQILSFGFPFKFYESGSYRSAVSLTGIRIGGLIANFYVIIFVSFGAGLACKFWLGERREDLSS
jgi:hypothetical protein